ncbi:MAG: hypothetical protein ACPL2D_10610 [Ignavibacteria bacterium]
MMNENAISQFTYLPQSKKERQLFCDMVENEILSGNRNPLEVEIMLKNLEETIKEIRKRPRIKEAVLHEAEKYVEKTFELMGCRITKTGKTDYDYSVCGDPIWDDLKQQFDLIKEKMKNREDFLKTLQYNSAVDPNTGVVLNPPAKTYTEYLKIELK